MKRTKQDLKMSAGMEGVDVVNVQHRPAAGLDDALRAVEQGREGPFDNPSRAIDGSQSECAFRMDVHGRTQMFLGSHCIRQAHGRGLSRTCLADTKSVMSGPSSPEQATEGIANRGGQRRTGMTSLRVEPLRMSQRISKDEPTIGTPMTHGVDVCVIGRYGPTWMDDGRWIQSHNQAGGTRGLHARCVSPQDLIATPLLGEPPISGDGLVRRPIHHASGRWVRGFDISENRQGAQPGEYSLGYPKSELDLPISDRRSPSARQYAWATTHIGRGAELGRNSLSVCCTGRHRVSSNGAYFTDTVGPLILSEMDPRSSKHMEVRYEK